MRLLLLVVLAGALAVAMVLARLRDTALRVVGHEWERVIEIEARTAKRWVVTRQLSRSGTALDDVPTWPEVKLERPGDCVGCEREGRRSATYSVRFFDPVGERGYSCSYDEQRWKTFALGARYEAEFDPRTGAPDCESLRRKGQ